MVRFYFFLPHPPCCNDDLSAFGSSMLAVAPLSRQEAVTAAVVTDVKSQLPYFQSSDFCSSSPVQRIFFFFLEHMLTAV